MAALRRTGVVRVGRSNESDTTDCFRIARTGDIDPLLPMTETLWALVMTRKAVGRLNATQSAIAAELRASSQPVVRDGYRVGRSAKPTSKKPLNESGFRCSVLSAAYAPRWRLMPRPKSARPRSANVLGSGTV